MRRELFQALAGRLAGIAVCGVLLGGLAGHAAVARPAAADPLAVPMVCFDPAAPERAWITCAHEAPL